MVVALLYLFYLFRDEQPGSLGLNPIVQKIDLTFENSTKTFLHNGIIFYGAALNFTFNCFAIKRIEM